MGAAELRAALPATNRLAGPCASSLYVMYVPLLPQLSPFSLLYSTLFSLSYISGCFSKLLTDR